jgi:sugar/nucleoside kinase (ribokinase family)
MTPDAEDGARDNGARSVSVVGSIAFDAVETPAGSREKMLGGAATHFALAASFFTDVKVVGPVGDDFGDEEFAVLESRNINTDDVERVPGGKTFFWKGVYGDDLNSRETLVTDLNVFEHFEPKLSPAARESDSLFLANIQPELQRRVRDEWTGSRFVALDSMNLWIDIARDALVDVIRSVDCVILNHEEMRQLTGKVNVTSAAREVLGWGPTSVVVKQGEYGACLYTADGFFGLPAYPLENAVDPTGAGDTFAGGLVGYVTAHPDEAVGHDLLCRAMAYGTALASYCVEEFGTERVARLTNDEIEARVAELEKMTSFRDLAPVSSN